MSKEVNGDVVKVLTESSHPTRNLISKRDNNSARYVESNIINSDLELHSLIDTGRIEKIKSAITNGKFNINPLRVAEKIIKFETKLSA